MAPKTALIGLVCVLTCVSAVQAQDTSAPLSAIDWLNQNPDALVSPVAQPNPKNDEPPVARSGTSPTVTVTALDGPAPRRFGLLPFSVTGMKPDLWAGSDPVELDRKLRDAIPQRFPAAQELLLSLMLTEADPLSSEPATRQWLATRVDALIRVGAVDPALALIEQGNPREHPALFARWLTLSLLARSEQSACRVLAEKPSLRPNEAARIYCTAQAGDFETAALLFGTAGALEVLTPTQEQLLARFLDPDLFEEEPLPRAPVRPDALTFRLFEAAGAPLPTAPLPLAYAHSDLSADAGWKSQLEAAERLARAGVLPSNQLLGLYSDRKPAASGGLWDRVAALQMFERALENGADTEIAKTLPAMWRGMQSAGLEVAFSDLFAERLSAVDLTGRAGEIAFRMALLSRGYEGTSPPEPLMTSSRYLHSVAQGNPDLKLAPNDAARSVAAGFSDALPPSDAVTGPQAGPVGLRLLDVLDRLADAGRGDKAALSQSLADLRALGLEDIARRVSLQFLILRADL